MGCGLNPSMQHTIHCISRRSVADETKTQNCLY
jgi:hypothetical protein